MRSTPKVRNKYPSERGNAKRKLRAKTNEKVSEERAPQFMHATARQAAGWNFDTQEMKWFQK